MTDWNETPRVEAPPDFDNILAVLRRERPARPTLFEFFLNRPLYIRLSRVTDEVDPKDFLAYARLRIEAFRAAGYDYMTTGVPGCAFPRGDVHRKSSLSLNEGAMIRDRASFEAYPWPDPEALDVSVLDRMAPMLPEGMKLILHGPSGVLENVTKIMGHENLCLMILEDEELAADVFEGVGSRLVRYYERAVASDAVGAIIGNDDWGFRQQTMLAPEMMRRFVFPWHERIVAAAHAVGKPAVLHSCGCLAAVMDDIIDGIGYDGKHSYEDAIQPVEEAYEQYGRRIAVMGGIDVDFVCRAGPEAVYERSKKMLERTAERGGYGLGTGNSVPEYVPDEGYFAMIRAAIDGR